MKIYTAIFGNGHLIWENQKSKDGHLKWEDGNNVYKVFIIHYTN